MSLGSGPQLPAVPTAPPAPPLFGANQNMAKKNPKSKSSSMQPTFLGGFANAAAGSPGNSGGATLLGQ